jgi:DNA-binding FadR family transcriptional regulator
MARARTSAPPTSDALSRPHLADGVFDELAAEILRGTWATGAALPAERTLAERFGTTRIIVRQAVHRLADIGLVLTRQGGATRVADLDDVHDLRVIELLYRLTPGVSAWPHRLRDIVEKQYLQGMCLVEVAMRRGTPQQRAEIEALVVEHAPTRGGERAITEFERRFWSAVAAVADNRIFRLEVGWWYGLFSTRHPRPPVVADASLTIRIDFYRELARRIAAGDDAVAYYMATVAPILATLDGGP